MDTESRSFLSTLDDYTVPLHRYLQEIQSHTQSFYKQEAEWLPSQSQAMNTRVEDVQKASQTLEANEIVTEQSHQQLRNTMKETQDELARITSTWTSLMVNNTTSLCHDIEESGNRIYDKVRKLSFQRYNF